VENSFRNELKQKRKDCAWLSDQAREEFQKVFAQQKKRGPKHNGGKGGKSSLG